MLVALWLISIIQSHDGGTSKLNCFPAASSRRWSHHYPLSGEGSHKSDTYPKSTIQWDVATSLRISLVVPGFVTLQIAVAGFTYVTVGIRQGQDALDGVVQRERDQIRI
jgi:hypothetical protein